MDQNDILAELAKHAAELKHQSDSLASLVRVYETAVKRVNVIFNAKKNRDHVTILKMSADQGGYTIGNQSKHYGALMEIIMEQALEDVRIYRERVEKMLEKDIGS